MPEEKISHLSKDASSTFSLETEARDMLAASKQLAKEGGTPSRAHLTEKPDFSR